MSEVIDDLKTVFALYDRKDVVLPPKTVLRWGDKESELSRGRINAMLGYVGGSIDIAGMKWIGSAPRAMTSRYGLPRASALIVLNDPQTMLPLAVMDGTLISAMRTGAVTGLAAKYLARANSTTVGIVGAGVQSKTQLLALKTALPQVTTVKVYSLTATRAQTFAQEMGSVLDVAIQPVASAEEAVRDAEIVVTATTAKAPVVEAEWFAEGCFYSHVGGHEAEFSVIHRADKIVVNHWEGIKKRGVQTLALMYAAGEIGDGAIDAELGDIVVDKKQGRTTAREFIYFNAVGMAMEDLAVAKRIYDHAKRKGIGTMLPLWHEPMFV
ncbi:ornithine cyclodeaminase [Numidum massiliense]|uniref:ornithine cyclodeaminase n=1 Tax=Numidum massiliense TaxID=1522315 RepID=UPI00164D1747|nr:ornithine cyclodeaminase [Numidum massiliense]